MAAKSRKEQILEMLAADPADAFLGFALAMEYASEGELELAVSQFRKLLGGASDYVPAYFQCGQVLARLGRSDEARQTLDHGIAVARQKGEHHTAEEMQALLLTLS